MSKLVSSLFGAIALCVVAAAPGQAAPHLTDGAQVQRVQMTPYGYRPVDRPHPPRALYQHRQFRHGRHFGRPFGFHHHGRPSVFAHRRY